MKISPFFLALRSGYQAEIDDLTFDSEGKDVLRQRLNQRRKESAFLLQMMEQAPEMVAVMFHQGFQFKSTAAMDNLLSRSSDTLPTWPSVAQAISLAPWTQDLVQQVRKEPKGDWFLAVAAGLEYMYGKADPAGQPRDDADEEAGDDDHDAGQRDDDGASLDSDNQPDGKPGQPEEAAADWLAEQGFDRKE
jgi:hypothetical protein